MAAKETEDKSKKSGGKPKMKMTIYAKGDTILPPGKRARLEVCVPTEENPDIYLELTEVKSPLYTIDESVLEIKGHHSTVTIQNHSPLDMLVQPCSEIAIAKRISEEN